MNIFVLDLDPVKAAEYHADKHVSKMTVELFQQLGSAVIRHGATPDQMPLTLKGTPLRGGYPNHPCTRWVGENQANFQWAIDHARALCHEYTRRYGKKHSCEDKFNTLQDLIYLLPQGTLTPHALAMPEQYRSSDVVQAYRTYYLKDKAYFAKWEKIGNTPDWWS